jgi:hypothetical protein
MTRKYKYKPHIAPDPRTAFTKATDNTERFACAVQAIDAHVRHRFQQVHDNPLADKNTLTDDLNNIETIETFAKEINRTPDCCSMIEFLRSCGAKNPETLLNEIVKASVAKVTTAFENYKPVKTTAQITSHRVSCFLHKFDLDTDPSQFHSSIDAKGSFQPISRRASLLPPIQPPVQRPVSTKPPAVVKAKLPKVVAAKISRSSAKSDSQTFAVVPINVEPEPVVAVKEDTQTAKMEMEVGTHNAAHQSHEMAVELLRAVIREGGVISLKPSKKYYFVSPFDRHLVELQEKLKAKQSQLSDVRDRVIRAHLLHVDKKMSSIMENELGAKFTYNEQSHNLDMIEPEKLSYPVVETVAKPIEIAGVKIKILVIDHMIKPLLKKINA